MRQSNQQRRGRRRAPARLGIEAERCAYVGNLVSVDEEGALQAGWTPLWYAGSDIRNDTYDEQLSLLPEGVGVIESRDFFVEAFGFA